MTLTLEREPTSATTEPSEPIAPTLDPTESRPPERRRRRWRRWSALLVVLILAAAAVIVVAADDAQGPAEKVTTIDLTPVDRTAHPAKPAKPDAGAGAPLAATTDGASIGEPGDTACVTFGPWSLLPCKDKTP